MGRYTIRYKEAGMVRVESASCDHDQAAIRHASHNLRDPFGVVEVWRAELVYHGTGKKQAGKPVPTHAAQLP